MAEDSGVGQDEGRDGESRNKTGEAAAETPEDVRADAASRHAIENTAGIVSRGDQPSRTPQLSHANTFPSTPGMRIPLEELIGSFDESTRKAQLPQESPEERIGWIPNSSSTLLTPNRKRKRARSSSPSCPTTSSQRQEASTFFAGAAAQTEKRTPDADPAAALWKQYATNERQNKDEENKLPAIGQLVFEGSPRALETPAKNAGFRRWASTGNDWPTSKTKKRRTATRTSINLWQDAQVVESAGRSKVSTLVDRIQESLATQKLASFESKPTVRISAPSSSSPLPDAGGMDPPHRPPAASPLQAKAQPDMQKPTYLAPKAAGSPIASAGRSVHRTADKGTDDRRLVECADDAFRPTKLHLQSKAPLPAYKRPSITRAPSNGGQKAASRPSRPAPAAPAPVSVSKPASACGDDPDEFGEDFDLSAEDLDELMDGQPPLHQRQLHQIPPHPDPPQPQAIGPSHFDQGNLGKTTTGNESAPILVNDCDDDDDEFACDDLDEASMVQAEFSATQAYRASLPSQTPRAW